jgi:hypothetical protein
MIGLLLNLLVLLVVVALVYWVITMLPLPGPIQQIATVIVVVIGAIALIYLLLGLTNVSPGPWRRW